MSSTHYLDFIGTVWKLLPEKDKERLGELWQGYEQIFAGVYQKFVENNLNVTIQDLLPFSTERWLPYDFTEDNFVDQPAIFTSSQDLSAGVNLATRYLLKFSVDNGTPFEVNIKGANPSKTLIGEIVSKINAAAGFTFVKAILNNSILQYTSPTSGLSSTITFLPPSSADASEFVLGLMTSELPRTVPEFPYIYSSPYPGIASIPTIQDAIRDESVTISLTEGTDYVVSLKTLISFKAEPPTKVWAKRSLFDEENPWNNFGFLMDIYQPNSARYVDILRGLWFAFWSGPKPSNVEKALHLLFGLPVTLEPTTVTKVTGTTVETTSSTGIVRTFDIPINLTAIVSVGDELDRFAPLVSGINVFDKISKPGFVADEIGRPGIQQFLTEHASRGPGDTDETKALTLLNEYLFLPQISVDAFIHNDINLGNVRTFLEAIKPLNKTFVFQILMGPFRDELALQDDSQRKISINLTPNVDSNETTFLEQTTLDDYETIDNDPLNVDSNGILLQERVNIEVYSFGILIDSFDL